MAHKLPSVPRAIDLRMSNARIAKWRHLVIVPGVLWLVPLYCRLCRVFSRFVPRALCKKCSKLSSVYFRWIEVFLCFCGDYLDALNPLRNCRRNGVTLNFPGVLIRYWNFLWCYKDPSEARRDYAIKFH